MDHGPNGSGNPAEIVNDNQEHTQQGKYNIDPSGADRYRAIMNRFLLDKMSGGETI